MKFKLISKKEFIWLILSVVTMGFCLSYLNLAAFGTDPCTTLNLKISEILGISLGNWQALFNCILFIFVFFLAKEQIGWGTLANMFLVGYSFDFFATINNKILPANLFESMTIRILFTIPALTIFVFAAAIYMALQQGTAPYDAIPFIIHKKWSNVPFRMIRMSWDIGFCMLGILLGANLGIVTLIMAFTLGPVISYVQPKIKWLL